MAISGDKSNTEKIALRMHTKSTAANSTFAIGGGSFSADSFVVAESPVLRINICAEKPAHRKSAKRYSQYKQKSR
jgi:hypothetical protein